MKRILAYKLAKPDGFDFYTGKTINYRENIGKIVKPPNARPELGLCSNGVIHASKHPNDCFVGAKIPCSAYRVSGIPVCGDVKKWGFTELKVIRELTDLDKLFGWRYTEAINPINPFNLPKVEIITEEHLASLKFWDSVRGSVWDLVWASVGGSVWASVGASVRDLVGASVRASVGAYIGSLFPNIKKWKYVKCEPSKYPYQPAVDLWKAGLVPSFDGKIWRLHSGIKAEIIWEGIRKEG